MRIVYLPGMDGTGLLSAPFADAIADRFAITVVRYPPDQELDYAALLDRVLEELPSDDPYVLLGESFSGPLAVLLGACNPPGLSGVVLCATFVRNPVPLPAFLRHLARGCLAPLVPNALVFALVLGRHRTDELEQLVRQAREEVEPGVLAHRVRCLMATDVTEELRAGSVPLFYLRAAGDRLVRRYNLTHIERARPDIQVASIPGPHFLLGSQPEAAAAAIAEFIEEKTWSA